MEKLKISSILIIIGVLGLMCFALFNIWLFKQQTNYENEAKRLPLPKTYDERIACNNDNDCVLFRDRCGELIPTNKKFLYAMEKQKQAQMASVDGEFSLCLFSSPTLLSGEEFVAKCKNNQCVLAREKVNTKIKIFAGVIILIVGIAVIFVIKKKRHLKIS
ncbi:MAG: hypothetical protein NTZ49_01235 [Candidatus Parcubacteria bacterium]|nr:hypothetical protein [Candidatus Parcubacteria bacterium]